MAVSTLLAGTNIQTYLGRIVCWTLPEGNTRTHAEVIAALTTAGLDPKAARTLCKRHAFVRAMRKLAKQKLVRVIHEDGSVIRFQMNAVQKIGTTLVDYPLEAHLEMCKVTGRITCADPLLVAAATNELADAMELRRNADITRLINQLFAKHADLFSIKGGCYFVPERHASFADQIEQFVVLVGGSMLQYPIPDGTPVGNQSVSVVIADGIAQEISEYEAAIESLTYDSTRKAFETAACSLLRAERRILDYKEHLSSHLTRLEDHIAYCRSRIIAKAGQS